MPNNRSPLLLCVTPSSDFPRHLEGNAAHCALREPATFYSPIAQCATRTPTSICPSSFPNSWEPHICSFNLLTTSFITPFSPFHGYDMNKNDKSLPLHPTKSCCLVPHTISNTVLLHLLHVRVCGQTCFMDVWGWPLEGKLPQKQKSCLSFHHGLPNARGVSSYSGGLVLNCWVKNGGIYENAVNLIKRRRLVKWSSSSESMLSLATHRLRSSCDICHDSSLSFLLYKMRLLDYMKPKVFFNSETLPSFWFRMIVVTLESRQFDVFC